MTRRFLPALLLMGLAASASAINLPGGAPTQPETEQARQRHERSTSMIVQGTVTQVDQAHSTLYVDGVPYYYHQFGMAPRASGGGQHGARNEGDGAATADSGRAARVEPAPGMKVSITVRRERSFNRARIVDLKQLGPEQNGN